MQEYKTCNKCKQILHKENFRKKTGPKANKDGLYSRCKKCCAEDNRDYRNRNLEKIKATKKTWRKNNPEKVAQMHQSYYQKNKKKIAAYNKQYRIKNADKLRKQAKSWRESNKEAKAISDKRWAQENKDKVRLASKRYRANNPEKAAANVARYVSKNPQVAINIRTRRRARIKGNKIYKVTAKDLRKIMLKNCAYCGSASAHLDHVIPISRGGQHRVGNLIASCAKCNQSKSAMLVSEWKLRKHKNGY